MGYEQMLGSRRQFLGWAGAGTAALVLGTEAPAALAAVPRLSSRNSGWIRHEVQHFRSRPDLRPPQIFIDTPRRGSLGGLVITETHRGRAQDGPVILDQHGRLVWFQPMSEEPTPVSRAFNVSVQRYRNRPVLAWFEGDMVVNHGRGHYRLVDTSYRTVAEIQAANGYAADLHEFFLTREGTAVFTCYGTARGRVRVHGRMRELPYYYGVVQEIDVATGKLLFEWRSDRHVPLSDSYKPLPHGNIPWDYFHINSISIDPRDHHLVISGRNTAAVYKIHRRTGRVIWRLGGRRNEFAIGPGAHFFFQHDVRMHPDGVMTVFDNEGGPPRRASQSRGLSLMIDERRRRLRLARAYTHHPPVYSDALGNVERAGHGSVFIGWGRTAGFTEYSRTGHVLFDGRLGGGGSSYRAFVQEWHATPATPPSIAVSRAGREAKVFASWNGATEVSRWGVLGGESPTALSLLGTARMGGFESEIVVPSAPAWMAVTALDRAGRRLATSAVVRG